MGGVLCLAGHSETKTNCSVFSVPAQHADVFIDLPATLLQDAGAFEEHNTSVFITVFRNGQLFPTTTSLHVDPRLAHRQWKVVSSVVSVSVGWWWFFSFIVCGFCQFLLMRWTCSRLIVCIYVCCFFVCFLLFRSFYVFLASIGRNLKFGGVLGRPGNY